MSGCVSVEYTASTQWAKAFIPEAASNLPGTVAAASFGLYLLLIGTQGRSLARRELDILEAVTGKSGEEGGQILG